MKRNQPRKQVLDTFAERLCYNFLDYCTAHNQDKTLENFITYLVDREMIDNNTIYHYAILEQFQELSQTTEHKKTKIVNDLADKFNLTPRSIWNILRRTPPTGK